MQSLKIGMPVSFANQSKAVNLTPAARPLRQSKVQARYNHFYNDCNPRRGYNRNAWQYSPFGQVAQFVDILDKQFTQESQFQGAVDFYIRLQIDEEEDQYVVQADVPGLQKEDLKVDLNQNTLQISGERKQNQKADTSEESDDKSQNLLHERQFGNFQRVVKFQKDVDAAKVQAKLENGVLNLEIPKVQKEKSTYNINIS